MRIKKEKFVEIDASKSGRKNQDLNLRGKFGLKMDFFFCVLG